MSMMFFCHPSVRVAKLLGALLPQPDGGRSPLFYR
jgi:hypothetical protein